MSQAGPGKIRLFDDFCGPAYPILSTHAVNAASGGGQAIGPFLLLGDLAETDTGVVRVDALSGAVRVSANDEDGKGVALVTGLNFQPSLNAPMIVEARVNMRALTTRSIFVGFCGTIADDIAEPSTHTGTAHTLTASHQAGLIFDSQLTAKTWHAIYKGGTTTGETDSTNTVTAVSPVAGEYDVLRVEIFPDGDVEYWVNGNREYRIENAVSTTTLQAAVVGCWGTEGTAADIDVDYMLVTANRDWTR